MTNEGIIDKLEEAIKSKDYELIGNSIRESGIIDIFNYTVIKECDTPLFRVRPQSTRDDYPCSDIDNFSYAHSPA